MLIFPKYCTYVDPVGTFVLNLSVQTEIAANDPVLVEYVSDEIRSQVQALQDSGTSKSPKVKLNVSPKYLHADCRYKPYSVFLFVVLEMD